MAQIHNKILLNLAGKLTYLVNTKLIVATFRKAHADINTTDLHSSNNQECTNQVIKPTCSNNNQFNILKILNSAMNSLMGIVIAFIANLELILLMESTLASKVILKSVKTMRKS